MAERLTRLLASLALAGAGAAAAQGAGLADPTRPPNAASVASVSADATGAPATGTGRLQSVLISPDRKLATIDGQTVSLGGTIGDATLVQITETQVTLKRGGELTTLELYPGVVRRVAPASAHKNREDKP